ncbi:Transcription factor COE1 [Nowakowskiella sp. JEL0407]|nr:Transcription factor COE1 [Nowakowskiella sp. JEL0407]
MPKFHGSTPNFAALSKILEFVPYLESLDLGACQLTFKELFSLVRKLSSTQKREVGGVSMKELGLCYGYNLVSIEDSENTELNIVEKTNSQLTNIEILQLERCYNIQPKQFESMILRFPNIRSLSLRGSGPAVTDSLIINLARSLRYLRSIDLTECHFITDNALVDGIASEESKCRDSLQELSLHHCDMVTDRGIRALVRNCRKISWLDLENCDVGNFGVMEISSKVGMSMIHLNIAECHRITDAAMTNFILNCPNLMSLDLSFTYLSDTTLYALTAVDPPPPLKSLSIMGCRQVTLRGVFHVARKLEKTLERLWIRRCKQLLVSHSFIVDFDISIEERCVDVEDTLGDGISLKLKSYTISEFAKIFNGIQLDVDVDNL